MKVLIEFDEQFTRFFINNMISFDVYTVYFHCVGRLLSYAFTRRLANRIDIT